MKVGVVSGPDGPTRAGCMCTKDEWRGNTNLHRDMHNQHQLLYFVHEIAVPIARLSFWKREGLVNSCNLLF